MFSDCTLYITAASVPMTVLPSPDVKLPSAPQMLQRTLLPPHASWALLFNSGKWVIRLLKGADAVFNHLLSRSTATKKPRRDG
jgi:hypothetical protein